MSVALTTTYENCYFRRSIRGLDKMPGQCLKRGLDADACLSDCHLNKQRLIKSLEAKVNESAGLIEHTEVTLPYKNFAFSPGEPLGPTSSGQTSGRITRPRGGIVHSGSRRTTETNTELTGPGRRGHGHERPDLPTTSSRPLHCA